MWLISYFISTSSLSYYHKGIPEVKEGDRKISIDGKSILGEGCDGTFVYK